MIYFGIDPGKSGSISAVWDDGVAFSSSCKLSETLDDICYYIAQFEHTQAVAMIEKVHSSPQMGVTSAFSFGQSFGAMEGILAAFKIKREYVSPQRWQKYMSCLTKGDKNISKARAQQLFPQLKITNANADSLLIAEYGRRFVQEHLRVS